MRKERRVATFRIVASSGIVRGKVSPERFLMKICIVDDGSSDADRELEVEGTIFIVVIGVWRVRESDEVSCDD